MSEGLDLDKATVEQVQKEIARLEKALEAGLEWPKKRKYYLHSSKEEGYDLADECGFDLDSPEAREMAYTGYEVSFDIEIERDGTVYATHLNGVALTERVRI